MVSIFRPTDFRSSFCVIEEYLKIAKASPKQLQVWFWDESGFNLRGIKRKNWCKKGKRKQIRGYRRKGRVNVMGGLRYSDKKRNEGQLSIKWGRKLKNKGNGIITV
jgi:DDE superfamily endonuclease